jgi:hypothetical protein
MNSVALVCLALMALNSAVNFGSSTTLRSVFQHQAGYASTESSSSFATCCSLLVISRRSTRPTL